MRISYTQILRDRGHLKEVDLRSHHITPQCGFGMVEAKPHLDQPDDDYEFVEHSLRRWADRQFR